MALTTSLTAPSIHPAGMDDNLATMHQAGKDGSREAGLCTCKDMASWQFICVSVYFGASRPAAFSSASVVHPPIPFIRLTFTHARACVLVRYQGACSQWARRWQQNGPGLFHDHVMTADTLVSMSSGSMYTRASGVCWPIRGPDRLLLNCHCTSSGPQVDVQQAARCDPAGLFDDARPWLERPWQPCVPATDLS